MDDIILALANSNCDVDLDSHYILCGICAFWMPTKEDSTEVEYGRCPIRKYPQNRTTPSDGCRYGETVEDIRRNMKYAD